MATTLASPARTRSRTGVLAIMFAGFVLSGIATTVIAPMLPIFIRRWSLDDAQDGLFPMLQFAAALLGSLLSGVLISWRGYRVPLVFGYALMGYGLATLNAALRVNALIATSVYGFGYGLITPGTNLYVAEAGGPRNASLLNLLNFTWGAGAMACSPLIAVALQHNGLPSILMGCAVFGCVLALALLLVPFDSSKHSQDNATEHVEPVGADIGFGLVLALGALFFTYVGLENGIGVWSAEFSRRVAKGITNLTTLAPMFFYAGLTSGRGLAPLALMRVPERRLVLGALGLTGLATALVILSTNLGMAVPGIFLAGFGCACVYPIYIAWLSRWLGGRAKHIGGVLFALASLGGATGPWLVGIVSKYSGSLRVGLLVALASVVLMMGIVWGLRRRTAESI